MQSRLDHVSLNVSDLKKSKLFYDALLIQLGYKAHPADGWVNEHGGIWINQVEPKYLSFSYHRKRRSNVSPIASRKFHELVEGLLTDNSLLRISASPPRAVALRSCGASCSCRFGGLRFVTNRFAFGQIGSIPNTAVSHA